MMSDEDELNQRIRERAYQIWLQEGQPVGKDKEHWDLARLAIAQEDGMPLMLKPIQGSEAESMTAIENQGEFPTLTDQGEEQTYPSAENISDIPGNNVDGKI